MSRKRRRPAAEAGPPPPPATAAGGVGLDAVWLLAALVPVLLAFRGVTGHGFLNWDDPDVLVRNARLAGPGVVGWAFSTGFIGHYQPLSWLAWSMLRRAAGLDPETHHVLSLALHLLNAGLVFVLASALAATALSETARRLSALAAALAFGLHPLRVEPVAWASAMPYLLATAPLLACLLAYLRYAADGRLAWLAGACGLYAVSILARPVAPGLAIVLLGLDAWLGRLRPWRRALVEKLPFAALGLLGLAAEASARRFAGAETIDAASRVASAAWAPLAYVARTLWPANLTPLDPQPLSATGSFAGAALAAVVVAATAALLALGRRTPALPAACLAYLVLIAPAALLGLAPSGLQATADRYTYLPGVALALLAGAAVGRLAEPGSRSTAFTLLAAAALAMGLATFRYLPHWRDSVALWTRALDVDPRNDVALYNLALALEEKGDENGAVARYDELLHLLPDHGPARRNRDRIEAKRLEGRAGALAQSGRLAEAVELFSRALDLDPQRLHARRSRGMALAQLGRFAEAIPDLERALAEGPAEEPVRLALAYARSQASPK